MTILDRIKELSKSRDKTVKEVAIELGLGENYLYSLKSKIPNGQTLEKLADYFHVSVDYLLGRDDKQPELPNLSVEQILDSVENYSGGELTESDREMLRIIIEAKKAAVEKESKNKG